jgi:hypothetical protein
MKSAAAPREIDGFSDMAGLLGKSFCFVAHFPALTTIYVALNWHSP